MMSLKHSVFEFTLSHSILSNLGFQRHTHPRGRDAGLSSSTAVYGSFPWKHPLLFLFVHSLFHCLSCCPTQLLLQGLLQV